jgi:hypothetical protein
MSRGPNDAVRRALSEGEVSPFKSVKGLTGASSTE